MKIPGFNLNVTFDTVLNKKKKTEIQEEVEKLSGNVDDSRKWLPFYQTAKKNIKERLSDEERSEIEQEVREWKQSGIPKDVQAS
jgi:hypothetical protein